MKLFINKNFKLHIQGGEPAKDFETWSETGAGRRLLHCVRVEHQKKAYGSYKQLIARSAEFRAPEPDRNLNLALNGKFNKNFYRSSSPVRRPYDNPASTMPTTSQATSAWENDSTSSASPRLQRGATSGKLSFTR